MLDFLTGKSVSEDGGGVVDSEDGRGDIRGEEGNGGGGDEDGGGCVGGGVEDGKNIELRKGVESEGKGKEENLL